jgi:hypothetical protein
MNDDGRMPARAPRAGTLAVLHPGVETPVAALQPADRAASAAGPTAPTQAPRLAALQGKRLALFGNGKVNAREIITAVGKRLEARHGVAETRYFRKRHAAESGAPLIPELLDWKPDLVLTALGD